MPDGDTIQGGLDPAGAGVAGDPALIAEMNAARAHSREIDSAMLKASSAAVSQAERDESLAQALDNLAVLGTKIIGMYAKSSGAPAPPKPSKISGLLTGAIGALQLPADQRQNALLGLLPGLLG